jgi:uncharacterized protein YggE
VLRPRRAIFLAAVLLVASAIAGVAQPHLGRSADTPAKTTITVSGHGTVTTVPDRASFDFTVESRAQTASDAIARTSDAAAAVARAVKDAGVSAADVQTSQISLNPQTTQDGTTVIGYAASITITAKTGIPKAGAVVDAAVRAGADGVSGPSLSRSDQAALYKQALANAVADAKDKASALAGAAGLTLGAVQTIAEGGATPIPVPYAARLDTSVPIEQGTQTIDATVTVTYSAG